MNRLVCEAFHGDAPAPEMGASHLNGVKTNNRESNLAWETAQVNNARKFEHGTQVRGEQQGLAKLAEADVRMILARHEAGETRTEIALDYPVTRYTVGDILTGRTWTHVTGLPQKKPPALLVSGKLVRGPHRASAGGF